MQPIPSQVATSLRAAVAWSQHLADEAENSLIATLLANVLDQIDEQDQDRGR